MSKFKIYWLNNSLFFLAQIFGWGIYALINFLFYRIGNDVTNEVTYFYILWFLMSVIISGLNRIVIKRYAITQISLLKQTIYIFVSAFIQSLIFFFILREIGLLLNVILENNVHAAFLDFSGVANFFVIFLVWNLAYLGIEYVFNYKKAEITELKLDAANKEVELNILKSQLNPHFLFNALNSIRALIDENPMKSREAITKLSNILRNILAAQKNREITFDEEIGIVKDYLSLEKIRYEERLDFNFDIDEKTLRFQIPPLMVQTLVENCIKHGIAKLPKGGKINIYSRLSGPLFFISITNTGKISTSDIVGNGIGIKNTLDRLELLYGNNAHFSLVQNTPDTVKAEIIIKMEEDGKTDFKKGEKQ